MNAPVRLRTAPSRTRDAAAIGRFATACLQQEIALWPKPGLVTPHDSGSHSDMDCALMQRSAAVLEPFLAALAGAGARDAEMAALRAIGLDAEAAMLAATAGVNTHRGAIFGLGLLCAAAGQVAGGNLTASPVLAGPPTLGQIVCWRWGTAIRAQPVTSTSHGAQASQAFGVPGARGEAASGFPTVFDIGLPALHAARRIRKGERAALVETLFALIAVAGDTNLLHRGGTEGLRFAKDEAIRWRANGGIAAPDWQERALACHRAFVERRLSPGGAADLLAMTLFVDGWERAP